MEDNISRKNAQSHETITMEKHYHWPTIGARNSTAAARGDPHDSCCLFSHSCFMQVHLLGKT